MMMNTPEPIPPKKDRTWIWVVAILAGLCLCLTVAVVVVGGVFLVTQRTAGTPMLILETFLPQASPTSPSISASPTPPAPSTGTSGGTINVVPFTTSMSSLPPLQTLVNNYQGGMAPGTQTWQVQVTSSEGALIFLGWCTSTQDILDQNYQHLTWIAEVDGDTVPITVFNVLDSTETQGYCRTYVAGIASWPVGNHTIQTTMRLDAQINDGFSDYAAGDYTDVYQVTVTP
jgi:hypothetical protein